MLQLHATQCAMELWCSLCCGCCMATRRVQCSEVTSVGFFFLSFFLCIFCCAFFFLLPQLTCNVTYSISPFHHRDIRNCMSVCVSSIHFSLLVVKEKGIVASIAIAAATAAATRQWQASAMLCGTILFLVLFSSFFSPAFSPRVSRVTCCLFLIWLTLSSCVTA